MQKLTKSKFAPTRTLDLAWFDVKTKE